MSGLNLPAERVHNSAASEPAKKFACSTGARRKDQLPSPKGPLKGTAT